MGAVPVAKATADDVARRRIVMHGSRPRPGAIKPLSVGLILAISLMSPVVTADKANAHTADVVYTNGKIYTVNEKQPWAEAVAIKDGEFLVVG